MFDELRPSSVEHPLVTLRTTAARVSLVQAPAEHSPDTQFVTGCIREVFPLAWSARSINPPAFMHCDAAGSEVMPRMVDWQVWEILEE